MYSDPSNGNNGLFLIPHFKIHGYSFLAMVSDGLGWEHVSVSIQSNKKTDRCPTWEEMCWVKDLFWSKDEVVIQYHPAESDYVNNHKACLHLWKPIGVVLPVPDSLMVGIR